MEHWKEKLITSILPFVKLLKERKHCELEGSLGKIIGGEFVPGVDFSYFDQLFSNLKASQVWSRVQHEHNFATFYFGPVRGRYNVCEQPIFVKKTTIASLDIECQGRNLDLRLKLSEERPIENYIAKVAPNLVRLHKRWSFEYKEAWKYDFSKVASGTSKDNACKSKPIFEIELELLPNSTFLVISDREIAHHIVEKLIDLLGRFNTNFEKLPLILYSTKEFFQK